MEEMIVWRETNVVTVNSSRFCVVITKSGDILPAYWSATDAAWKMRGHEEFGISNRIENVNLWAYIQGPYPQDPTPKKTEIDF